MANNHTISRNASVRNCTLEDIDAVCLDFQRYELRSIITEEINSYFKDSFPDVRIPDSSGSHKDWFDSILSHSQECLSPTAVRYIQSSL